MTQPLTTDDLVLSNPGQPSLADVAGRLDRIAERIAALTGADLRTTIAIESEIADCAADIRRML